jgi:hypothetical protein
MRKLERYIARYGPEAGPKLFHLLQSQAGHASVSARLRRKLAALTQQPTRPRRAPAKSDPLPLFPDPEPAADCLAPPVLGGCGNNSLTP